MTSGEITGAIMGIIVEYIPGSENLADEEYGFVYTEIEKIVKKAAPDSSIDD